MLEPRLSRSWVIPSNEYRRERWRNQQGWTREIYRDGEGDGDGNDWSWRLSIAEIERDCPFSSFPGIDRELVLLSGNGMRLRFDDGEVHELHPPHSKLRFSGERGVTGELIDGPTHDFNLMWRRDRVAAELWHRPLVGPMVIFAEAGSRWAVHLLAGRARFADDSGLPPMQAGDTAIFQAAPDSRVRHVIEGGGELLVIRIRPEATGGIDTDLDAAGRSSPGLSALAGWAWAGGAWMLSGVSRSRGWISRCRIASVGQAGA